MLVWFHFDPFYLAFSQKKGTLGFRVGFPILCPCIQYCVHVFSTVSMYSVLCPCVHITHTVSVYPILCPCIQYCVHVLRQWYWFRIETHCYMVGSSLHIGQKLYLSRECVRMFGKQHSTRFAFLEPQMHFLSKLLWLNFFGSTQYGIHGHSMGYMDTVRDTWTQYGLYGHSTGNPTRNPNVSFFWENAK